MPSRKLTSRFHALRTSLLDHGRLLSARNCREAPAVNRFHDRRRPGVITTRAGAQEGPGWPTGWRRSPTFPGGAEGDSEAESPPGHAGAESAPAASDTAAVRSSAGPSALPGAEGLAVLAEQLERLPADSLPVWLRPGPIACRAPPPAARQARIVAAAAYSRYRSDKVAGPGEGCRAWIIFRTGPSRRRAGLPYGGMTACGGTPRPWHSSFRWGSRVAAATAGRGRADAGAGGGGEAEPAVGQ